MYPLQPSGFNFADPSKVYPWPLSGKISLWSPQLFEVALELVLSVLEYKWRLPEGLNETVSQGMKILYFSRDMVHN